jgi:hypothetical protein
MEKYQCKIRRFISSKRSHKRNNINFSKDENYRHFFSTFYIGKLSKGEKHDRRWLIYSKDLKRIFCFYYKLLERKILEKLEYKKFKK